MRLTLIPIIFSVIFCFNAHAQAQVSVTASFPLGLLNAPARVQGVGLRAASQAAIGQITVPPLSYLEIAVIGIAIITNNNDNDGQPATFTGGSGSNMAGGG